MRSRAALSSEQLATSLLFTCIGVFASLVSAKSDTWWQLRSGADIWRERVVSLVDTYSYTARGSFWPNHEWLTEVLFHGAYHAGGIAGLAAFCALAILLAHILSWRLTTGRFDVRFGLVALTLTAAVGAWSMRPQVVTMLCFMVTCTLIARDKLWWLVPFFVLWANLHGGVGLGLITLGAVVASDAVTAWRVPLRTLAVAFACFLSTAATPLGMRLWQLLVGYAQRSKTNGITEWMPPGPPPEYFSFWLLAAVLVVTTVVRWRVLDRRGRRLTSIALCVLPLALGAHRNVAMFLLIVVPALTALLSAGKNPPRQPPPSDYRVANGVFALAGAIAALVFVSTTWKRPLEGMAWAPVDAAGIAAIRSCDGALYNALNLGGLMIHFVPDRPVFIDNRIDPYPVELLAANLRLEQSGEFAPLFERYGIRCAIVEPDSHTALKLRGDKAWSAVYNDGRVAVFQKR